MRVEEDYRRARVRPGGAPDLPDAELDRLVDQLEVVVDIYLAAPEALRQTMRAFFGGTHRVTRLLQHVATRASGRMRAVGAGGAARSRALEQDGLRYLAVVSLTDIGDDFRDTYMGMGALWLTLTQHGVPPSPLFQKVAALSSEAPSVNVPYRVSAREYLEGFERSEYFRTSVAPSIAAQRR